MKVIVVTEEDIQALVESLELQKFRLNSQRDSLDELHRRFHYEVVSWAQKHGSTYPNH